MTVPTAIALGVLAVVILEGISWTISVFSESILSRPIPRRGKFLDDQTRQLDRLLHGEPFRSKLHPIRGWCYNDGRIFEGEYINAQGVRGERLYAADPAPGIERIAAFGDSYVYGTETADHESWTHQIEAHWRAEVLNYGIGGYSVDQALLHYREQGARLKPRLVLLGFTTMMATRVVSCYRRFEHSRDGVLFKPRFVLEGEGLRLIPTPVPSVEAAEHLLAEPASVAEFGPNDFWFLPALFDSWPYRVSATYRLIAYNWFRYHRRHLHPDRIYTGHTLNPRSESFRILSRIYREFAAEVRRNGSEPVALMLPTRSDLDLYAEHGSAAYDTLRAELEADGLRVIDLAPAFPPPPALDELFNSHGHYTPKGNAVAADAIARALNFQPKS